MIAFVKNQNSSTPPLNDGYLEQLSSDNSPGQKEDFNAANLKALVINDEFFILQMLILIVNECQVTQVDQAQNGYDGYKKVLENQYDFVICDLNMPVMDGYQCAK